MAVIEQAQDMTRRATPNSKFQIPNSKFTTALGWLTAALMLLSLYAVFIYAPIERTQGPPQKIFYFHVPLAWDAYLAFFCTLIGSIAYLRTAKPKWDVLAYSAAEIGVVFTSLV